MEEVYEEDEKDGGEYAEYDESVELLIPPVLVLRLLFINEFLLAEVSWAPSR